MEIILSCQYILVKAQNLKVVCALSAQVFHAIVPWDSWTKNHCAGDTSRNLTVSQAIWRLERNTVLEIREDPWFWWHENKCLKHLPKTFCSFNTFIWTLSSTLSLPGTLEGSKIRKFVETRRGPKNIPEFTSDQPLIHYRQAFWEADLKNNPKTQCGRRIYLNANQFGFRANHSTTLQYVHSPIDLHSVVLI